VRRIWISEDNIAPAFPAGLTGVEILTSQSPCTTRSPFPAGLKKLIATKFSFQPKNKQPPPWWTTLEKLQVKMAIKFCAGDPLPHSLKKLSLQKYSGQMRPGELPPSLVKLHVQEYGVGSKGGGVLPAGVLPEGLKSLSVGGNFVFADGALPPGLVELTFQNYFEQQITAGMLPPALKVLRFMTYNKPLTVGVLPEGLRLLVLGEGYNHGYNHPLQANVLPTSLECLILGPGYHHSFIDMSVDSNVIPEGLRVLDVSDNGGMAAFFREFQHLDRIRPLLEIKFYDRAHLFDKALFAEDKYSRGKKYLD
jgi:hypothetical protein